ncbi:hypothetical protein ACFQZ4_24890 [Catellatospora coxensis]
MAMSSRNAQVRRVALGTGRIAVALAVLSALVACGPAPRPVPPAASPTATAQGSAAPTAEPTATPGEPEPSSRCLDRYPAAIPDAVFLPGTLPHENMSDSRLCYTLRPAQPGEEDWPEPDHLPRVCAAPVHASDALIADRRGYTRLFDSDPSEAGLSTVAYDHTVTRYTGTGAVDYLAEVRRDVQRCGAYTRGDATHEYRIVSGPRLGDESLRMTVRRRWVRAQEGMPREATYYVSVVRRGTHVSVVLDHGWEGAATSPAEIFKVMAEAAERTPAS